MRYTGPKKKLCRREWKNLFGTKKYILKKWSKTPWQHWTTMARISEYGKLLRNKQSLKRMYWLSEKQFYSIVMKTAKKYSKNKWVSHDQSVMQFLERRCDSVLLRSWFASTIMQARQMMVHWHWKLNWHKHNVPSYFMKPWDVLMLKDKLKSSSLYEDYDNKVQVPVYLKVDKNANSVEMLKLPDVDLNWSNVDILKVIEFYARV